MAGPLQWVSCAECLLQHGAVVETGTHDQLVDQGGLYSRLWTRQVHIHASSHTSLLLPCQGRPCSVQMWALAQAELHGEVCSPAWPCACPGPGRASWPCTWPWPGRRLPPLTRLSRGLRCCVDGLSFLAGCACLCTVTDNVVQAPPLAWWAFRCRLVSAGAF